MGAALSKQKQKVPELQDETQMFALWTLADVKELLKRFRMQVYGFALVEAQFESIMCFKKDVTKQISLERLFEVLDNDHDGRIDGLELLGGLALCCQASHEEKMKFCFELYDFNLNASMSKKEMIMMMMASICGMTMLTGGDDDSVPGIEDLEALAEDAFLKADRDGSGNISYEEFLTWARSNRDLMATLDSLNKTAADAINNTSKEDSADEMEDNYEEEASLLPPVTYSRAKRMKTDYTEDEEQEDVARGVQWLGQLNEPTSFKPSSKNLDGPDTNLELCWAFGYRAKGRNNLRYIGSGNNPETPLVVYPTASLAVVYNQKLRQQMFYQGHQDEIVCLDLHPSGPIVATADCRSNIHIWNAQTLTSACIIRGLTDKGIGHIRFSPHGDRLATVSLDSDHTVVVFDTSTGEVISSAKGLSAPNEVFDMSYSNSGTELVVVGRKQVRFYQGLHTNKRTLETKTGHIGHLGKKQNFYCVAYCYDDAVVGCASGEIYRFSGHKCVQVVQAHGLNDAVLCLSFNMGEGILVSGGQDSLVKCWDSSLIEVGSTLDMSEDLDNDGNADSGCLDSIIMSVQSVRNRLLIGTRGCDAVEVRLAPSPNDPPVLTRIGWGHFGNRLWGLAAHPLRDEFATSGGDRTLRIWSIRSKEEINVRQLPAAAESLAYNPSGRILALGMTDGTIALLEANHAKLRAFSTWKHAETGFPAIKFSPNSMFLAAACRDGNIYVYRSVDKINFRRQAVCRGHSAAVTKIDFSSNSSFLQSNGEDSALLYWDIRGNRVKTTTAMRDTSWATQTCIFGWAVKGIWPARCEYNEVNCCSAMSELGDIVTGDDYHKVNLYRYPSVVYGALFQSYVGHASPVHNICFTYNKRIVLSIGETDGTILLWKHEVEQVESSDEDGNFLGPAGGYSSDSSNSSNDGKDATGIMDTPDVEERSLLMEAANRNFPVHEMVEIAAKERGLGVAEDVRPWKTSIVEPSVWNGNALRNATDCDLTLKWVHGYRCHDCRGNLFYSSSGAIVYTAACLGIVYSKSVGKQKFLQGAHLDEVLGIAAHPTCQLFATADCGHSPSLVIWNSSDMRIVQRIEGAHCRGIPLLAFNSRGNILASIGLDCDHSLVLHDWVNGVEIMRSPTDKSLVHCMCFLHLDEEGNEDAANARRDVIVTGGHKHMKFWWAQGRNVKSQRAMWGREKRATTLAVASGSKDICVSGTINGHLLVWHNFKAVSNVKTHFGDIGEVGDYPHMSSIQCIWAIPGVVLSTEDMTEITPAVAKTCARYISGDKSGVVAVWCLIQNYHNEYRLKLLQVFNAAQLAPRPMSSCVRSLCERDGILLVGTLSSEIFEVALDSVSFLNDYSAELMRTQKLKKSSTGKTAAAAAEPVAPIMRQESGSPGKFPLPVLNGYDLGHGVRRQLANGESHPVDLSNLKPPPLKAQRLICGHSSGQLWGLVTHPSLQVYFTAGDDGTIRCWDLTENRMLSYVRLPEKSRAIDILPTDARDLAVALNTGHVMILKTSLFLKQKNDKKGWSAFDLKDLKGEEVAYTAPIKISHLAQASGPEPKSLNTNTVPSVVPNESFDPFDSFDRTQLRNSLLMTCAAQWIQEIRYCFNGKLLAVGSHDFNIYLFNIDDSYMYNFRSRCCGHTSYITHLDFGLVLKNGESTFESFDTTTNKITITDKFSGEIAERRELTPKDICLHSTCGGYELNYWRVLGDLKGDTARIESASTVKDAWWATWTSPLGWPVQGIWAPQFDGTEIYAVDRSHSWEHVPVIATADNFGRVKLFNYPCVNPGAPDKCYRGHGSHITNVRFMHDDTHCITTGGTDRCIFVWETDIADEMRERMALQALSASAPTGLPIDSGQEEKKEDDEDGGGLFYPPPASGGDESAMLRPWRASVREPSDWSDPPGLGEAPEASLEMAFVYGYRGWDCRNNIGFADSSYEVVYHVGKVGIVYDSQGHKQIHNTEHSGEILCLAMHPEGHTVATGELGVKSKIVLWDANTGVTVRIINFHRNGVSHLAFSESGVLLTSVGMDEDRTVAVFNARTGAVLGTGKAGRSINVLALAVTGDSSFVTGGKNHIKFWDLPAPTQPGGELASKGGIYNKAVAARTVVSASYLGSDAVTGMSDGSVLLWKDRSNTRTAQGHTGSVTAMCPLADNASSALGRGGSSGPRVVSGGKDGLLCIWNQQLAKLFSIDMNICEPKSTNPQIQALAARDGNLLVGTIACEIFQVSLLNSGEVLRWVQGHFDGSASVAAVATHPQSSRFVTASEDMTVRTWCCRARMQKEIINLEVKSHAVAYSPDGGAIAVGSVDGKLRVLSADLRSITAEVTVSPAVISCVQYSPDGHTVAVGSRDSIIYLLDGKTLGCRAECKGHSSGSISAVDFSDDGTRLQSASTSYELMFWNVADGSRLTSPTELRDVVWSTVTCTFGWSVQGLWPSDVRSPRHILTANRSPDGRHLVAGDDSGSVQLLTYPSPLEASARKSYVGHGDGVSCVRFSQGLFSKYAVSVGGLDKTVIQWELVGSKKDKPLL